MRMVCVLKSDIMRLRLSQKLLQNALFFQKGSISICFIGQVMWPEHKSVKKKSVKYCFIKLSEKPPYVSIYYFLHFRHFHSSFLVSFFFFLLQMK